MQCLGLLDEVHITKEMEMKLKIKYCVKSGFRSLFFTLIAG